jgi:guanylate kinase
MPPDPLAPYLCPPPVVVVITGPSGVGKDSILREMRAQGSAFHFVVTATDRCMRPGEVEGEDYLFVSTAEFERMIRDQELLEYACVYGQYKGVPKSQVRQGLAAGKDVLLRVDVQGAETLCERLPGLVSVFLAPPSIESLAQRLRGRGTDTEHQVETRLTIAREEIALIETFDYVVINREGKQDQAARQIMSIIEAEKLRARRRPLDL